MLCIHTHGVVQKCHLNRSYSCLCCACASEGGWIMITHTQLWCPGTCVNTVLLPKLRTMPFVKKMGKDRLPVTWIVHFKPHVSKYACSNSSDFYPTLCSDFAVGGKQVGSIKSQMMRYKSSCLKTNPQGDWIMQNLDQCLHYYSN